MLWIIQMDLTRRESVLGTHMGVSRNDGPGQMYLGAPDRLAVETNVRTFMTVGEVLQLRAQLDVWLEVHAPVPAVESARRDAWMRR